jgi:hypothetical protein
MIRKLKIIDDKSNIDHAYFLFYFSIITSIAVNPSVLVLSFLVSVLIFIRDHLNKKTNIDLTIYESRLESIESDLTALKIGEGIKVLR